MGALLLAALVPSGAVAATVSFDSPNDVMDPALEFFAAPGEVNRLSLRLVGSEYSVRDSGAAVSIAPPLRPSEPPSCRRSGDEVRCQGATGSQDPADIYLGDRNDSASIGVVNSMNVFGQGGSDVIVVTGDARQVLRRGRPKSRQRPLWRSRQRPPLRRRAQRQPHRERGNDILDGRPGPQRLQRRRGPRHRLRAKWAPGDRQVRLGSGHGVRGCA